MQNEWSNFLSSLLKGEKSAWFYFFDISTLMSGDARILKNWRAILCSIQKLQIEALYEEDFSPNRLRPLTLSIAMKN